MVAAVLVWWSGGSRDSGGSSGAGGTRARSMS